ncbi:DnaA/Hda family protein [Rummeliibacillus stabekisii]|uniref:DnaA ATPase domain-containing protein n=1 Tax=Rummeliibacillus stabekisii TaxID=241244 RepID=UPI00203D2300|nr:DnaA/Hda family protein [Rummeliibacillus stabekisii]MCM3316159.1 DnaA/Hda family protein [Rummeliibacillus stabekisii]
MPTIAEVLKKMQDQATLMMSQEDIAPSNFECETCKDAGGWTEWRDADVFGNGRVVRKEKVWVECSCAKQRKHERLINGSHITQEFQKMRFENFVGEGLDKKILNMAKKAKQYYDEFEEIRKTSQNGIALLGQPGIGKTHLLMAISNNLMLKKHIPVMYFPFVTMTSEMRANQFEKEETITRQAKEIDVLFIDDLYKPVAGKPKASEWEQLKMYDIVNYRYLNRKPILLSCELDPAQLLAIDEATGSRLFEMTQEFTVSVEKDFRLNYRTRKLFNKEDK